MRRELECDRAGAPRARPIRLFLLALIGLAVAVRVVAVAYATIHDMPDADAYRLLAEQWWASGVYGYDGAPVAMRPPLYPLLLWACMALGSASRWGIAVLHLALGLATIGMTARLGRRWSLGPWSLLAAAWVAWDPILVRQSMVIMTETLAAFLVTLCLDALTSYDERPHLLTGAWVGACLALAMLCRPTFAVWTLVIFALLLIHSIKRADCRWAAVGCVAATVIVLAPWTVRNWIVFHRPIALTSHGGYTLLLANNPFFYDHLKQGRSGVPWDSAEFFAEQQRTHPYSPLEQPDYDRWAYREAWRNIRNSPEMFARACLYRLGRLWSVVPLETDGSTLARWFVATWYLCEFALVIAGIAALGGRAVRAPWAWGWLLVVSLTAVHLVYWTDMRMRAPLTPFLALLAAVGAGRISRFNPRAVSH